MKNKGYKILFLTLVASIAFSACGDKFLDEQNPNTITSESFWQTEEDFQAGLITVYAALQYQNVTGGSAAQYENIKSDAGRSFDFYQFAYIFDRLEWNQSTGYINDRWKELYIGVNRANQVIEKLEAMPASEEFPQDSQDLIMGQARFLRGMFYFWIANSYGGAVMRTSVPTNQEEINSPFEDRQKVIDEIVKPDLQYAMKTLPTQWSSPEDLGRVTWGAATAALGKVHLYDVRPGSSAGKQSYDSAAYYLYQVISSGIYSLVPNIGDNFTDQNEFNSESIFEVSWNDNFNPGVSAASQETIGTTEGAEANNKAKQACTQLKGGWRVVVPTHWVNELYESDAPDPALPMNNGNNYSSRAYWSIAFLRQDDGPLNGMFYQKDGNIRQLADWFNGGAESCYWKKGTNWYHWTNENTLSRSGINERIIRLADVYLMYAEAILNGGENFGGMSALDEALMYVDMVRARAGVILLSDYASLNGRIPVLHKRGLTPGSHPSTTLNEASLLTHIQMVERVLELSFEGVAMRWNDLVRWGLVREAFENQDEHVYIELDPATGEMVSNGYLEFCGVACPEIEKLAEAINRYSDADVMLERYNPDLHDYYPIPEVEFLTNSGL